MTTSIDHLILAVEDLDQATAQYAALLGRVPSWRAAHPDYGTANTLFKLDNTYIELLAPDGDGMAADIVKGILAERGNCLGGLVFGTDDAENFIAHARSRGLEASDPVPGHGIDEVTGAERHWHNIFWDPAAARGILSFVLSTIKRRLCLARCLAAAHRYQAWIMSWSKPAALMQLKPFMASNWAFGSRWSNTYPNGAARSFSFVPAQ